MTFLSISYVPHERAVEGTLIHILGKTPFVNAIKPSCLYITFIVDHICVYLTCLTSNSHSFWHSAFTPPEQLLLFMWSLYVNWFLSHISLSLGQDGLISYVCSLVLTTSNGLVQSPAIPPEKPAHRKYQKWGLSLFHGLRWVLRFSLVQTTTDAKGIFIITVMGYDL